MGAGKWERIIIKKKKIIYIASKCLRWQQMIVERERNSILTLWTITWPTGCMYGQLPLHYSKLNKYISILILWWVKKKKKKNLESI